MSTQLKIKTFTDSVAIFVSEPELCRLRTHLHALLCQFSASLEEDGFGYVASFDKNADCALKFCVQNSVGPLQEYKLTFTRDFADVEVEMDDAPLCVQSTADGQVVQTMVGGEKASAPAAFP